MSSNLTPRELETFAAFAWIEQREGRPAKLREVAEKLGRSHVTVHGLAQLLVAKGFMQRGKPGTQGTYVTVDRCPMCFQAMPVDHQNIAAGIRQRKGGPEDHA